MNNQTQIIIAKLRFPKFIDSSDWVEKCLGAITKITIGEFVIKTKQNPKSEFPVYNGGISYTGFYEDYNNEANQIVISARGANAGFVNLVKKKYWAGNSCYSVSVIDYNAIDLEFLFYYIKENQKRFTDNQQAANIPSVSKSDVQKFIINYPLNILEQQKIASCLSSLDDLITAHTQKLQALKQHKKGLMQNLFPAEGETVPKLRFKGFEDSGEWVEKTLDNLTTKIGDGLHSTPKYYDSGDYFFINGNNLIGGKIEIGNNTKRVDKYEYELHKKELSSNTILLSINGTIGNIAVYNNEKVILGKSACYINIDSKKTNLYFIIYYLQTQVVNEYFISELTGSTIKNLSLKSIKNTIVFLPKIEEQQKIATCLYSLDELITAQSQKIENLKQHKKGLMQQLFPQINS
jgi:type I restriction enzyme S subunit